MKTNELSQLQMRAVFLDRTGLGISGPITASMRTQTSKSLHSITIPRNKTHWELGNLRAENKKELRFGPVSESVTATSISITVKETLLYTAKLSKPRAMEPGDTLVINPGDLVVLESVRSV